MVVVIGTPVDEHLNPDPSAVVDALTGLADRFRAGQLVILRSTVFPGVTRKVEAWFAEQHPEVSVAFCPERIAEGFALSEIVSLPQLVGARIEGVSARAAAFFETLGVEAIEVLPEEAELASLAHKHDLPFVVDLGSGALADLADYGLPHERTPAETLADGADIVTFSGDKLLGGPQAGLIVGRADLIETIRRNPMKRAMRLDKVTIAALEAVFRLYADPARLPERVPTIGMLARAPDDIAAAADRMLTAVAEALDGVARVEAVPCRSQIGSGSLPVDRLESTALSIRPLREGRGAGGLVNRIADAFRALPAPVIGRVQDGAFLLDLRCLEDEAAFSAQLPKLALSET